MQTSKTIIYRIQDSVGRGPYKPGFSKYWNDERCLIPEPAFPPYFEEFPEVTAKMQLRMDLLGGHCGCGFRNLDQLHIWFDPFHLKKLHDFNYYIAQMGADEILAEGKNQLVFWRKIPLRMHIKKLSLLEAVHARAA